MDTPSPLATVVMVPRERFSGARASLEDLFQNTRPPFDLIYVDGHGPADLARHLDAESRLRGFRVIRSDRYLSPNEARNLALPHLRTRYAVFVDNDIEFEPG